MASSPFPRLSAFSPAVQNTDRFSEFNRKRVIYKDQEIYLMGGGRRQYRCIHNVKRQPMKWEEISANNVTNKGLILKIHKYLIQFNILKY